MKLTKKNIYSKLAEYTKIVAEYKPAWGSEFRIYYGSIVQINKILQAIEENPWYPENWYSEDIFSDIKDAFEELENIHLKIKENE